MCTAQTTPSARLFLFSVVPIGLPYRILNRSHKKELLRSLWVGSRFIGFRVAKFEPPRSYGFQGLGSLSDKLHSQLGGYQQPLGSRMLKVMLANALQLGLQKKGFTPRLLSSSFWWFIFRIL